MFSHNYDDQAFQRFTGSHLDYRRKGIVKAIKSSLILYLHEHYPKITKLEPSTLDENTAMNNLNKSLGFK